MIILGRVFLFSAWFLILSNIACSDSIISYRVEIEHPQIDSLSPLVIKEYFLWNGSRPEVEIKRYWPLIVERCSTMGNGEMTCQSSLEGGFVEQYDAFHTIDKNGYILIRRKISLDCKEIKDVKIVHYKKRHDQYGYKEYRIPTENLIGSSLYWTRDGKYIVSSNDGEEAIEKVYLKFIEVETGRFSGEKEFTDFDDFYEYEKQDLSYIGVRY